MSMQFTFWKGADEQSPRAIFERLMAGEQLPGLAEVDAARVLAALHDSFPGWEQQGNLWHAPGKDDTGPGFDLTIGPQHVNVTCYGMEPSGWNSVLEAMEGLGLPLYDPQIDERFPL